ncbi:MAG TPA: hypothetical protein GXX63_05160 [Tissierellia bacterium]|nr:hypothetical protein [Tissierellia bacterium]
MKINSKVIKILSLAIVVAMIIPSFSFASGKVSKEETVYVNLDEKGAPIEKTSSIWLHSDTSLGKVKDKSTLKEIKNVKGEEEPKIDGDKIVWETDEKDIFYQGKSNKDLPIDVEVKYYLNEKEVEPKDIAGKSGKIKIKLEVKNKDSHVVSMKNGKQKTLYTPFVTVAVMNMPLDKFKNVNTNSGKLVSDGNNQVITYVALPGVKESLDLDKDTIDIPNFLEVEADVTDFEMSPIVITTTSEIPEIDDISGTEDLDELIDGIEKIKEASEKLSEATGKLYEGQISLSGGIDELVNGVGKVNKGANDLSKGLSQLDERVKDMPEQTEKLDNGMKGVVENTSKIQKGQEDLTSGLGEAIEGLEKIKAGKEKELEIIGMLLKGMDSLDAGVAGLKKVPGASGIAEKIGEGLQKQRMALEGLKDSSNQLIVGVEEVEKGIKQAQAASGQLSTGLGEVNKGQKQISGGISQLNSGSKELSKATGALNSGADALSKGTGELSNGSMKLKDGSNQLKDGAKELDEGMNKFHKEGISEISKRIDESDLDIDTIMDTKDELINLSKEYNSFTGASEEMESSVKFVMKTEQIKGEEEKEELNIENKEEEKGGFINWLKNLFKKEK